MSIFGLKSAKCDTSQQWSLEHHDGLSDRLLTAYHRSKMTSIRAVQEVQLKSTHEQAQFGLAVFLMIMLSVPV